MLSITVTSSVRDENSMPIFLSLCISKLSILNLINYCSESGRQNQCPSLRNIDVGDRCWRQFVLATLQPFLCRISGKVGLAAVLFCRFMRIQIAHLCKVRISQNVVFENTDKLGYFTRFDVRRTLIESSGITHPRWVIRSIGRRIWINHRDNWHYEEIWIKEKSCLPTGNSCFSKVNIWQSLNITCP